jgi:hypothetical protein
MARRIIRHGGLVLSVLSVVLMTSSQAVQGQQGVTNGEWRATGGDGGQTRYSPLDQITRDSVKDLRVAWTFRMDTVRGNQSQTAPVIQRPARHGRCAAHRGGPTPARAKPCDVEEH